MSAIEPGRPTSSHEPSATIALRVGAVVAVALVLSVAVNVFAGSVAFAALLTVLAGHAAWNGRDATGATRSRSSGDGGARSAPAPKSEGDAATAAAALRRADATPPLAPSTPAAGASARS